MSLYTFDSKLRHYEVEPHTIISCINTVAVCRHRQSLTHSRAAHAENVLSQKYWFSARRYVNCCLFLVPRVSVALSASSSPMSIDTNSAFRSSPIRRTGNCQIESNPLRLTEANRCRSLASLRRAPNRFGCVKLAIGCASVAHVHTTNVRLRRRLGRFLFFFPLAARVRQLCIFRRSNRFDCCLLRAPLFLFNLIILFGLRSAEEHSLASHVT